ncbi:MAG: hypothetical protein Q8K63_09150 [Acidimicrobiales bacterium]|nr:hypothetical protein [Acidimicrobiales bacterium]
MSIDTVRRRMRAGAFPRAVRGAGPNAPWRIPMGDLVAAGLAPFPSERSIPPAHLPRAAALTADEESVLVRHAAVLEEVIAVLGRQLKNVSKALEAARHED